MTQIFLTLLNKKIFKVFSRNLICFTICIKAVIKFIKVLIISIIFQFSFLKQIKNQLFKFIFFQMVKIHFCNIISIEFFEDLKHNFFNFLLVKSKMKFGIQIVIAINKCKNITKSIFNYVKFFIWIQIKIVDNHFKRNQNHNSLIK